MKRVRTDSIRALGFFLIVMTITFSSISWYTLGEISLRREETINEIKKSEWILLRNSLELSLDKAKSNGQTMVEIVDLEINKIFGNDYEAIAESLDNYNEPNNPIRKILTTTLEGRYFNNIYSDNTDPFVVRGTNIETDNSTNCAAYGSSRSFEDEYTMHANPQLAVEAFNRIRGADLENMNTAAIDRPIFFQFISHPKGVDLQTGFSKMTGREIPEDHKGKLAQELTSYDINGLEDYFMRTGSWEETFYSFEFITPSYIFNKEDLAGRPFVENGRRTPYKRLSINVVFNFKTVIDHNPILKRDLERFEWRREEVLKQYIQDERLVYLLLILTILICSIGMRYTNKLATMEWGNATDKRVQS